MNNYRKAKTLLAAVATLRAIVACTDCNVMDALEDIENIARTLYEEDNALRKCPVDIYEVFRVNSNNPNFNYMFSFTTSNDDTITTIGESNLIFDADTVIGIIEHISKSEAPERAINAAYLEIMKSIEKLIK
jgi:hypothetical protein